MARLEFGLKNVQNNRASDELFEKTRTKLKQLGLEIGRGSITYDISTNEAKYIFHSSNSNDFNLGTVMEEVIESVEYSTELNYGHGLSMYFIN